MSITYPLTLPSTLAPASAQFTMASGVVVSDSPFTGEQQVYVTALQRWEAHITYPPLTRAQAEPWLAIFGQLNGQQGTFYIGDRLGKLPQGAVSGSPLVNGASQSGNTLAIKNLAHSITAVFKAGDYINLGTGTSTRLYKVLFDANSDSSGNTTVTIWPSLRVSPNDGDAVTFTNTVGVFRLTSSKTAWSQDADKMYRITLDAIEAL